jgi:predicted nucleic acid-binding protein
VIVLDTSLLVALLVKRDQYHQAATDWYGALRARLVTTPLVLSEVDGLMLSWGGSPVAVAFRREVIAGAFAIQWWDQAAVQAAKIANQYTGLGVSLADASLVALADRLQTVEIATFDERDFRAMRPLSGGDAFRLLPSDAS